LLTADITNFKITVGYTRIVKMQLKVSITLQMQSLKFKVKKHKSAT